MNGMTRKRKWYAWILLAVFVPMMLCSLTHVHEQATTATPECADCAHHVHHTHLATANFCMDNCVLCQMLSLPFIAAILLSVILFSAITPPLPLQGKALMANGFAGNRLGRAPPQV